MSLVRFEHAVAFEPHEIANMTAALDDLLTGAGGTWPPRSYQLVVGAGRLLLAWHPHRGAGGDGSPAVSGLRASEARPVDGGRTTVVEVATGEVLDAAADLLDAAEVLLAEGHFVAGYAIEGLQGRLIEAAVGVGRIERGAALQ